MKHFIIISILLFNLGCNETNGLSQQRTIKSQETQSPSTSSTPSQFTDSSNDDSTRLDRRLPASVREVLEEAEQIELFELVTGLQCNEPKLSAVQPDKFQDCEFTKKAVITDPSIKRQLFDSIFYAVGSSEESMACFSPRHGLRAVNKGQRVELVICFKCHLFRGVSTLGKVGGGISPAPMEIIEKILADPKHN